MTQDLNYVSLILFFIGIFGILAFQGVSNYLVGYLGLKTCFGTLILTSVILVVLWMISKSLKSIKKTLSSKMYMNMFVI